MKLSINFYHYQLPFRAAFTLTGVAQTHRKGVIVTIGDEPGNCGVGEIAPLPGLHRESLEDIYRHLGALEGLSLSVNDPEVQTWQQWSDIIIDKIGWYSATVRFGIESAVVDWFAKKNGQQAAAIFNENYRELISINGLINLMDADWEVALERLISEGYRAIKVKVGRSDVTKEAEQVKHIINQLPDDVLLRLDVNRHWTLEDAYRFTKFIDADKIEYVEEPLQDLHKLSEFYRRCGLPLAMDEALQVVPLAQIAEIPGIKALILKPSVLGGLRKTLTWAAFAEAIGCYSVLSSSVESGVGLAMLAHLAAAIEDKDIPAGLDTYRLLADDVLTPPFSTCQGKCHLTKNIQPDYFKLTRL